MNGYLAKLGLFSLILALFSPHAIGQILLPTDSIDRTQGISLPIRSQEINTQITDQTAVTTLEQEFFNPLDRQLEATYVMAIPHNANVSDFRIEINNELIQGEILDKDKAETIYQDIVRKLKDPGILSLSGRGMIRARIFPVAPKSSQKIRIRYEEVLKYDRGICRYDYSLSSDKLCKKPIDFIKITVSLSSSLPIRNIYSPSHDIAVKRESNFKATAKYSEENVIPEQDFQFIFSVSENPVGMNLLTYKENSESGFFLFLAAPKITQEGEATPKDVLFVLDKSGSMKQNNKIKQAKDALQFCIRSLNPKDRFAVIVFSDEVETLTKITDATETEKNRICGEIQNIEATGGTFIEGALKQSLELVSNDSRPTYLLFLTDGLPTVGNRNIDQLIAQSKERNKYLCRIFTFGVGYDVNTLLLDQLSQTNKGLATYVKPSEDIEVSVSSMYSKISNPALTDLKLDWGNIETSQIYPKDLPDLFSGSQLIVLGRYKNGDSSRVTLSGKVSGKIQDFKEEFSFARDNTHNDYIPRLWAARRIGFLINEIRMNGKNDELIKEIVELSKKYGILTEYTSFLVTDAPIAAHPIALEERNRTEFRALQQTEERLSQGMGGMGMGMMGLSVGKEAVAKSETLNDQLQNAPALSSQNVFYRYDDQDRKQAIRIEGVRFSGQQAFFNRGEEWISTQFDANQSVLAIKSFSEAYFQLANLSPDIAQILALSEKVSFIRNGQMIQIAENGVESLTSEQLKALQ